VFPLRQLLHIVDWVLIIRLYHIVQHRHLPSILWIWALAHLILASACDLLPSRLRTELDEEATDIFLSRTWLADL